MAGLFADGFDHYATADITETYTQIYTSGSLVSPTIGAYGRRSTNGMRWRSTDGCFGAAVAKVFTPNRSTFLGGLAFTLSEGGWGNARTGPVIYPTNYDDVFAGGSCSVLLYVRRSGATHLCVTVNTNGTLSVRRGHSAGLFSVEAGTVLGTTTEALLAGQYYYIELEALIDDAAGSYRVVVNGDEWLSDTGVQTRGQFPLAPLDDLWDEIAFGRLLFNSGTAQSWAIDDLYVADDDDSIPDNTVVALMGDTAFDWYQPTEDDLAQFTPSTGSDHFALVDEIPPNDDADYNSSTNAGDVDTFGLEAPPADRGPVTWFQPTYSRRRLAGGNTSSQPVWRWDGTVYARAAQGDPSTYAYHHGVWNRKPDDYSEIPAADVLIGAGTSVGYKKTT